MCFSKELSITSFLFGMIGSIILLLFGKNTYKSSNMVIGIMFIFVSFMQLIEYMIWSDMECKKGLNKFASYIGPLFNYLQPLLLFILTSCIMKSLNIIPTHILLVANAAYLIYLLAKYEDHMKTNVNLCIGTNETGHLKWTWGDKFNYLFYIIILLLNMVNYYNDKNFMIASGLIFISLLTSITKFNKNVGEIWCLMVTGIPYINMLIQYTGLI